MVAVLRPSYLIAGAAVAAALIVATRGPRQLGADLGGAAVDLVEGVLTGAAEGIADITRDTVINPYVAAAKLEDTGIPAAVGTAIKWTNPGTALWEGVKAEWNWLTSQF